MGQVCRKHEEFYEKACRWCEPEKPVERPLVGLEIAVPLPAQMAAAQQNAAFGSIMGKFYRPPRQPGSCACGVYVLGGPDAHVVDHHRIHHSISKCVLVLP